MHPLNRVFRRVVPGLLVLVSLALLPWSRFAGAQEPPPLRLEAIEPAEGEPGQRLSLTLWGEGFNPEMEVFLGDGIVEEGREFIDDGTLRLEVRIVADAPPGFRAVEIWHPETDQRAVLPQGFFVRGAVAEPTPPEPFPIPPRVEENGGIPWGIIGPLAGLLGLIGVSVTAYLGLDAARRGRVARQQKEMEQWQDEAQQELPRQCRPGARLPIIGRKVRSDTWAIVHLVFAVQASAAGQPYDDQHTVGGKIVQRLNEIVALHQRTNDEDRLRRMVAPLAKELARLLWVWTQKESRDRPIAVEAKVEGQVTYTFKLYECQKTGQGNRWKEIKDWEGAIKETDTLVAGELAGPLAGERKDRFQGRAAEALIEPLLRLTSEVRSMA